LDQSSWPGTPCQKTESIASNLIGLLLELRDRAVGRPQVALDGAQADAEFFGDLALGGAVDAVAAKDRGGTGPQLIEPECDTIKQIAADRRALRRGDRVLTRWIGRSSLDPV
jgi:hypothetical protein